MKGTKKKQQSDFSVPELDLGQLERLLSFMSEHGLEEFEYVHGDLRIRLKKAAAPTSAPVVLPGTPASVVPPLTVRPVTQPAKAVEEQHIIKSPIVGTYYAGPNPEAEPFVRIGDMVEVGQTVCIIEAMKLMNEIEADISGQITQILVENGHPVEYGEPLFALRATGKKQSTA